MLLMLPGKGGNFLRSSKYVEAKNLPPTAAAMKYMYHTL